MEKVKRQCIEEYRRENINRKHGQESFRPEQWEYSCTPEQLVFEIIKSDNTSWSKDQVLKMLEKIIKMTRITFDTECNYIV